MPLKTTPFDPVDYLDSPETMAFYLQDAIESGDAEEIADSVAVVARARARFLSKLGSAAVEPGGASDDVQWPELLKAQAALTALGLTLAVHPIAA